MALFPRNRLPKFLTKPSPFKDNELWKSRPTTSIYDGTQINKFFI